MYREQEKDAILNCCGQYTPFTELPLDIQNQTVHLIERSLYNITIDKAKEKNIAPYWSDDDFVAQYSSIGYIFKINVDPASSVNRNKPKHVGEYVIKSIYNIIIYKYFLYLCKIMGIKLGNMSGIEKYILTPPYTSIKNIGLITVQELNPFINEVYIDQLKYREQQEVKIKFSRLYTCKCGEKKTKEYEIQTRSGDEGGTLFVECIVCHKVWRP